MTTTILTVPATEVRKRDYLTGGATVENAHQWRMVASARVLKDGRVSIASWGKDAYKTAVYYAPTDMIEVAR